MDRTDEAAFERQFGMQRQDFLAGLDFYTWTRHYYVFRDLCGLAPSEVLEVGSGDGVLRRCAEPFVGRYTVMDINANLAPDLLGDLSQHRPELVGRFDAAVAAEVLEHLPFDALQRCIAHLASYLRPGGHLLLTLPHRKAHLLVVTPRQRMRTWRLPIGLTSLSEAYNRFVRRRIWIDPHHCWEIGDGRVRRADVETVLHGAGLAVERFRQLPYCDYWVLRRPAAEGDA